MSEMIEESIMASCDLVNAVNKKIRILEIAEQTEIQNNADG
jgi:hypothetical protein